jgi:hypothetical protein
MNRRNFFAASAAPVLASVFSPLRSYAQESKPSDALRITRVDTHVIRTANALPSHVAGSRRRRGSAAGVKRRRRYPRPSSQIGRAVSRSRQERLGHQGH